DPLDVGPQMRHRAGDALRALLVVPELRVGGVGLERFELLAEPGEVEHGLDRRQLAGERRELVAEVFGHGPRLAAQRQQPAALTIGDCAEEVTVRCTAPSPWPGNR